NNIIANNIAGWDGAGVSLQDALVVNLINNTIIDNDSLATAGTLFGALFAPLSSAPTPCYNPLNPTTQGSRCTPLSNPQPSGLPSGPPSPEFHASLPNNINCPTGHGAGNNGLCRRVSFPILYNDVLWRNRTFNINVATPTGGAQQSTVTLVPQLNQSGTGQ